PACAKVLKQARPRRQPCALDVLRPPGSQVGVRVARLSDDIDFAAWAVIEGTFQARIARLLLWSCVAYTLSVRILVREGIVVQVNELDLQRLANLEPVRGIRGLARQDQCRRQRIPSDLPSAGELVVPGRVVPDHERAVGPKGPLAPAGGAVP